jgi:hypothetical protein
LFRNKRKGFALTSLFILILTFFIPLTNASAYNGGLLEGQPLIRGSSDSNIFDTKTEFTDNDLNTFSSLGMHNWREDNIWYEFSSPKTIGSYYINFIPSASDSYGINLEFIDENGNVLERIGSTVLLENNGSVFTLTNSIENVSKVLFYNTSTSRKYDIYEFDVYEGFDNTPPSNVGSLTATGMDGAVNLSWSNPTDTDLNRIFIEDGAGEELYSDDTKPFESSTTITDLINDKTYTFTIYVEDEDGNRSSGESVTVKPFAPVTNVKDLKAEADYDRVDLSWKLPESSKFKHVNIYREKVVEEPGLFESLFLGTIVSAAEEDTKIFETNGTYFNDFTVEPETTYEYTLTSEGTDGAETDGVSVEATTLEEPTPEMGGVEPGTTPEGDFLYTWKIPTEGQVKVFIAGEEYATVNAADGQIIIPKEDMKLTVMGEPDVYLQPIGKYGAIGAEKDLSSGFEGIELPFGPVELLKSGTSLLMVLGSIVLLSLSLLLLPRLRTVIFESIKKKRSRT